MTILKELTNLKTQISAYKTSQFTGNDSYRFYKYKTDNLYTGSYRLLDIFFRPDGIKESEIVCKFVLSDYASPNGSILYIDATNPLHATLSLISPGTIQDWQRYSYVSCLTNANGFLEVIVR